MLKKTIKILSIVLVLVALLLGYAYFIEPNTLKIENQAIKLDCLNNDLPDKFVQISDLHFTEKTSQDWINRIYDKVAEPKPAAVFITGDFISNEAGIAPAAALVKKIAEKFPVYAVFGNWDYWALDYEIGKIKKELESAGAKVLVNEAIKLDVGGGTIDLLGVKDPYTSGEVGKDLEKSLRSASGSALSFTKVTEGKCKILLAHSPDVVKAAQEKNIDLILVGHTHGGQVYVPFVTEKIIPANTDGKGFVKGLYKAGNTQMYVNRGIGTSVLPFRFLVPPEVTVIKLEKGN